MKLAAVVVVVAFLVTAVSATTDCSDNNFCSGHGQCRNGACVCHAGFGHTDCSMKTTNCPDHCFGHGTCLDGICTCDEGYTGTSCNLVTESCPRNCTGHGMCVNGACVCFPGLWSGEACDVEIYRCPTELLDCSGHGTCGPVDWENETSAWACTCEEGFCGDACDKVCGSCPNNCSGQGLCRFGSCACDVGFTGDDCSLVTSVLTCPNNCTGHGRCLKSGNSTAPRCQCDSCYTGPDCSHNPHYCPGNCSGHGVCGCDGKCACRAGYTGVVCETVVETCDHLGFCSGNGVCKNNTCKCNPGFAGASCRLACPTGNGNNTIGCHAPNRGSCFELAPLNATCVCKPEFTGVACEERTNEGLLDDYINGWNPIGTVVLALVSVSVVLFVGMFGYNYSQGKRGVNAVPGVSQARSRIKADDYEAIQDQRTASNY